MFTYTYDNIDELWNDEMIDIALFGIRCKCGGIREISVEQTQICVEDVSLYFRDLHLLVCECCGDSVIPFYSLKLVQCSYDSAISNFQKHGVFHRKEYRERFDYCNNIDFDYDAYDYYNISGLQFDQEHPTKGFLCPVYFDKKVFQQFYIDDDYDVNLFSETYGNFAFEDEWNIPFGVNTNNNIVFWLGDLNYLDSQTLNRIKPFNISSDHKIVCSEFWNAQMENIFSKPHREYSLYLKRNELFVLIKEKYSIDLEHLPQETENLIRLYRKPITISKNNIKETVGVLHKILIESVSIGELRKLYLIVSSQRDNKDISKLMSIKLYEGILKSKIINNQQLSDLLSPLFILNDLRQYYDHLLPQGKVKALLENLNAKYSISSFDDVTALYETLLTKLEVLFQTMLVVLA